MPSIEPSPLAYCLACGSVARCRVCCRLLLLPPPPRCSSSRLMLSFTTSDRLYLCRCHNSHVNIQRCVVWAPCRYVLMPMNEPTFGTPRKSQIQTFLEQVCDS